MSFAVFPEDVSGFDNSTILMDCGLGDYSPSSPYCNTTEMMKNPEVLSVLGPLFNVDASID